MRNKGFYRNGLSISTSNTYKSIEVNNSLIKIAHYFSTVKQILNELCMIDVQ